MPTLNTSIETSEWAGTTPTIWDEALYQISTRRSWSDELAGQEGSDAAVVEKMNLTQRPGQTITFTTVDPLLGEGVSVKTSQEGNEEEILANTFSLSTVFYRHATATDFIAQLVSVVGRKWPTLAADLLGDWLGRRKDDDILNQVLNTDTITTLYAGGASTTSRNAIAPGSYLTPQELRRLAKRAQTRGAVPLKTFRTVKSVFPVYCAMMSEVDYYNLTNDADFQQDVRLAAVRGDSNPALSNQLDMYKNCLIMVVSQVPSNTGFMGSYLRPQARLRTAMTAAQTTIDVGPTTQKTNVDYGKYFPQTGSGNRLLIDSEIISYTGAAATDPSNTGWATVSRAAAGSVAATHAAGAFITLNNLGKVLVFGRGLIYRGWSAKPRRIIQERDYQFEKGIGLGWMYGLKSVVWGDSTVGNAVVLETYSADSENA